MIAVKTSIACCSYQHLKKITTGSDFAHFSNRALISDDDDKLFFAACQNNVSRNDRFIALMNPICAAVFGLRRNAVVG